MRRTGGFGKNLAMAKVKADGRVAEEAARLTAREEVAASMAREERMRAAVDVLTEGYLAGRQRCLKELMWQGWALVSRLATLAESGDREAAIALLFVLRHGVRRLERLTESHPDHLVMSAKLLDKWPGFLTVDHDQERKNGEMIARLELGRWMGINYEGKMWSRETPEVAVALELWSSVNSLQDDGPGVLFEKGVWESAPYVKARALAAKLQPLSRANYVEWWRAAEPVFVAEWGPAFEERKEFKHYWRNAAYRGERNARALIRRDIKAKIKQAFRTIAPKRAELVGAGPSGAKQPAWARKLAGLEADEVVLRLRRQERVDARLAKRLDERKKGGAKLARGGRAAT